MASVQEQHTYGTHQFTAARTARFTEAQASQNLTINGGGAQRRRLLSEKLLGAVRDGRALNRLRMLQ